MCARDGKDAHLLTNVYRRREASAMQKVEGKGKEKERKCLSQQRVRVVAIPNLKLTGIVALLNYPSVLKLIKYVLQNGNEKYVK